MRTAPLFTALAVCALACSCRSGPDKLERREVPGAIESARAALAANRSEQALELMRAAANTPGLEPATRDAVQTLLESSASRRIEELSGPGRDPEDLAELVELDLPRQIAVTAGIRAARGYFAAGEAVDAYRLLRRLDTKFPLHHERAAAGDLLVDIGLWLVVHGTGWFGLGHSTDDAVEVLEYVVLQHPSTVRCDEAYESLAQIYVDDREFELAVERLENLVLFHPHSARVPRARARIPHLRLAGIRSPEYDRSQLLAARTELERWLTDFTGREPELERGVRVDLGDCLRRLCDSDVIVADFYARVDKPRGERYHLERAVEEARAAGDEARLSATSRRLAKLPPAEPSAPPVDAAAPKGVQP